MARRYFVIDCTGSPSWDEKNDALGSFESYRAPSQWAKEIAERDQDTAIHICMTVAIARKTGTTAAVKKLLSK